MGELRLMIGVLLGALGALASAGCSPNRPPTPESPTTSRAEPSPSTRAASPNVAVGSQLAQACKLPTMATSASADKEPTFDFDQSELSTNDRNVLGQIARCLTTGPLRGRAVRLVGRADPRGESEYNLTLGSHRADTVRIYLTQLGVDGHKIAETSRGELDASGKDEDGYRRDRRVDVLLQ